MLKRTITRFFIIALAILLAPVIAYFMTGSTGSADFLVAFFSLAAGVAIGASEQWFNRTTYTAPHPADAIERALLLESLDRLHDAVRDNTLRQPKGRNAVQTAADVLRQIRKREAAQRAGKVSA